MKILNLIGNLVLVVAVVLLGSIALGTFFSARPAPLGLRVFVVQSGSMEPNLKVGSIVVTKPFESYVPGEVITFLSEPKATISNPGMIITHRITSMDEVNDKFFYHTRGDANQGNDQNQVGFDQVLGRVVFSLPYLGFAIGFARTRLGFISLIAVPALVIIFQEIIVIINEVKKTRKKKMSTGVSEL